MQDFGAQLTMLVIVFMLDTQEFVLMLVVIPNTPSRVFFLSYVQLDSR